MRLSIFRGVFIITMVAAAVVYAPQGAMAKEVLKHYVIGIHFASVGGQSSSSLFDLVKMIVDSSAEETGYDLELKKFPSHEAVAEAWLKNEIDGGLLHVGSAVWLVNNGGKIIPWTTFTVDKKDRSQTCFWHRKDMPIESATDLMGKSLIYAPSGELGLITIRQRLLELGVDEPLWKVFGGFVVAPSGNSTMMALAMKEGDLLWNDSDHKYYIKLIASNLSGQLSYDLCSDYVYSRGFIGINPNTVKKEDIAVAMELAEKYVKNVEMIVKEHPELQAMYNYAKLAKMKIVMAKPDEYEYELKLYKKGRDKGWVREAQLINEQLKNARPGEKVVVKPDMNYCKGICAKGDSDCVLSCLE